MKSKFIENMVILNYISFIFRDLPTLWIMATLELDMEPVVSVNFLFACDVYHYVVT